MVCYEIMDGKEEALTALESFADKYPHQVVIDLREEVVVSGFQYLPRAEEGYPGMVKEYKAYTKMSPFKF